jgi:hypothetical protein
MGQMTRQRSRQRWVCSLFVLCLLVVALSAAKGFAPAGYEFKLLIKPAAVGNETVPFKAAAEALWARIETVVAAHGMVPLRNSEWGFKDRIVSFVDTPGHDLFKRNFLLRFREDEKGKRELTLKFRSADKTIAGKQQVGVSGSFSGSAKAEADVLFMRAGLVQTLYAKSLDLKFKDQLANLGAAAAVFPCLGALGLPATVALEPVSARAVKEKVCKPGVIRGAMNSNFPVSVSRWVIDKERGLAVYEVSFSLALDTTSFKGRQQSVVAGVDLLQALAKHFGTTVIPGQTKTEWLFETKR